MKKEISVQNLCSDREEKVYLTLCVIAAGCALVVLVFGMLCLAALFT